VYPSRYQGIPSNTAVKEEDEPTWLKAKWMVQKSVDPAAQWQVLRTALDHQQNLAQVINDLEVRCGRRRAGRLGAAREDAAAC
jgi:hypothetical protein